MSIACNKWLRDKRVKESSVCGFCDDEDDIQHFLLECENASFFWRAWIRWWKQRTDIDISNWKHLEECIMFGFPGHNHFITLLNYCALLAKYFVYINKICENNILDFYSYLVLLKQKLKMETVVCSDTEYTTIIQEFLDEF